MRASTTALIALGFGFASAFSASAQTPTAELDRDAAPICPPERAEAIAGSTTPIYTRLVPADSSLSLTRDWLGFVTQAIARRIMPNTMLRSGHAGIVFDVLRDGRISNPKIASSNGNPNLGRLVEKAVTSLSMTHFLPPPVVAGRDGDVALRFEARAGGDAEGWFPVPFVPTYLMDSIMPAMALPGNRAPPYPDEMRRSNRQGTVLISFVVDTDGRADLTTVIAEEHPGREFFDAVFAHLPSMRYRQATLGDCRIANWVTQPFSFTLRR